MVDKEMGEIDFSIWSTSVKDMVWVENRSRPILIDIDIEFEPIRSFLS